MQNSCHGTFYYDFIGVASFSSLTAPALLNPIGFPCTSNPMVLNWRQYRLPPSPRDIFGCHSSAGGRGSATRTQRGEARDAAQCPTAHRTAAHSREPPDPNVSRAKAEKP